MADVTAYTAEKTEELLDENIVGGHVSGDNLILEKRGGGTVNAGDLRGEQGDTGDPGPASIVVVDDIAARDDISGVDLFEGLHAYVISEKLVYFYNGSSWKLVTGAIPHTGLAQEPVSISSYTSTSFGNFAINVTKTITKLRDDTKLVVLYMGSLYNDNALGQYEVAIRVDGVDHVVANGFGSNGPKSGGTEITGLDADTYTCTLRRRRIGAAGNVWDGQSDDAVNMLMVTETF